MKVARRSILAAALAAATTALSADVQPTTQVRPVAVNEQNVDYNFGAVGAQTPRVAAQVGNAAGAADFGAGQATAQTQRVLVADNAAKTYSAGFNAVVMPAAATDVCTLTGSASKTVRLRQLIMSGTQTTTGSPAVFFVKRSTADSAGTSTTATDVPWDSADAAGTATVRAYTVNPTLGTSVGPIIIDKFEMPAAGAGNLATTTWQLNFGDVGDRPLTLRGAGEVFAINFNGTTITGGSLNCNFIWTEE